MKNPLTSIAWAIVDKLDRKMGVDPSVSIPAVNAVSGSKDIVKVKAFYPNGDPVVVLERGGKPRKCPSFEKFERLAGGEATLELMQASGKAVSDSSKGGFWE